MEASRRTKYLNAFGVVQYRRRSLSVVNTSLASEEAVEVRAAPVEHPAGDSKPGSKVASIPGKPAAADDLLQELEQVHADLSKAAQSIDSQNLENSQTAFGFDLLVWRTEKLMVLEFSVTESERLTLKHRLVNNILKALWPQDFTGVELHQHSWPMKGATANIRSATEWLNSLVTGHLHHESHIPIWVMGEAGLKMLFPEKIDASSHSTGLSEQLSELMGTSIHHEKLDVELIISPSLKHISESAVAKAQIWQLLKPIR